MSPPAKTRERLQAEGNAISVTVLADNTVTGRGLLAEHGLAYWIDTGTHRLLFDTGQGLVLAANARQLGLDLATVTGVALSHGHYDHTGGLRAVLAVTARNLTVFAHPDALTRRYHCTAEGHREIGIPEETRALLGHPSCRLALATTPTAVAPGVFLTGEVQRHHAQETIDEPFFRDAAGRDPDLIRDDQAMFFGTAEGTVVLLGCAHSGLINTLDAVQRLTGGDPIHTVIGGMHLRSASATRLAWTIEALRRFRVRQLLPTHCTGIAAAAALWNAFPKACRPCGVGTRMVFALTALDVAGVQESTCSHNATEQAPALPPVSPNRTEERP